MSLDLDERQHAMLLEMGVRLFQPVASQAPAAPVLIAQERQPVRASVHFVNEKPVPQAPGAAALPAAAAGDIALLEWDALAQAVADCRACALSGSRRSTVFGSGDRRPDWLVVGDPPGENEDLQGEPFAGQPGQLLDNMLRALGLNRREKVYLTNAIKCRPPGNRNPEPAEVAQCEPFLRRQVELLQPGVILAMGRFAVQALLQSNEPLGKLRGQVHRYNGVPVVVTYHPSYLLRNLADKGKAWADLCLALEVLGQRGQQPQAGSAR